MFWSGKNVMDLCWTFSHPAESTGSGYATLYYMYCMLSFLYTRFTHLERGYSGDVGKPVGQSKDCLRLRGLERGRCQHTLQVKGH
jgi:hypothetical protein